MDLRVDRLRGMSVFISYASEDVQIVEDVETALQRAAIVVNRDRRIMEHGGKWDDEVLPLIRESTQFLLFWSGRSAGSANVMREIMAALDANRAIIPVLLDESPIWQRLKDHQVFRIGLNGDGIQELIAAVRPASQSDQLGDLRRLRLALDAYNGAIRERFDTFQVLYPGAEQPTESRYVPLALVEGIGADLSALGGRHEIRDLIKVPPIGSERLVLAGHPGAGKSTSLWHLTYKLASGASARDAFVAFLTCKDFRPNIHATVEDFVYEAVRQQTSREVYETLAQHNVLDSMPQVLIFDGVDEVRAGVFRPFVDRLRTFLDRRGAPITIAVVSTRIDSFSDQQDEFEGWRRYSIEPLDANRIERFVNSWFPTASDARALLSRLQDPRLRELASRPFLLAMMCLVFEQDRDLGRNRSQLFAQASKYLEYRRQEQTVDRILTRRHEVLCELALRTLQMGSIDVDRAIASGIAAACIEGDSQQTHSLQTVAEFLDELARETGILQVAGRSYVFLHRSLQEYYAALGLQRGEEGEETLFEHCVLPRWEEPIRLYAGTLTEPKDQARIVRRLWEKSPALALRVLTECTRPPAGLLRELLGSTPAPERVRMLEQVYDALSALDPEQRQRLAVETAGPLLLEDSESAVIYHAVQLLERYDPNDESGMLREIFRDPGRLLRKRLLDDPVFRFEFVHILPGKFVMGDDSAIDDQEKPAHPVSVDGFAIQRFQLTNVAYEEITGRPRALRPKYSSEDFQPVVDISWYDAYVVGLRVACRLPTEAEWEYAARASTTTAWSFGEDESQLPRYANFEENPLTQSTPWVVGTGEPNPWGLYDVHGNVWEWCSDWLGEYHNEVQHCPQGPAVGTRRVRRGGGHSYHARGCRSSFRWGNDPSYSFRDIGVRLACDERELLDATGSSTDNGK